MTSENMELINTIAQCFSALGTLAAVVTALYLSRREFTTKAKPRASISIISGEIKTRCASISVTNTGHQPITIESFEWHLGFFKKQRLFYYHRHFPYNSAFPARLEHGDRANLFIPLHEFEVARKEILSLTGPRFLRLKLQSWRIVANTSTGKEFSSRVSASLREWIVNPFF